MHVAGHSIWVVAKLKQARNSNSCKSDKPALSKSTMLLLLLVYSYGVSAQTLSVNVTEEIVLQPGATVEETVSIPDGFLKQAL